MMNLSSDLENYVLSDFLNDTDALNFLKIDKLTYKGIKKYCYKITVYHEKTIENNKINFIIKKIFLYDKIPDLSFVNKLTHLSFGKYFNQNIDNLPQSLTHLTFDTCFDQKIDNLPKSLIYLELGQFFDQNCDNLPENLIHLNFKNSRFKRKINNLPKSLTHLTCGREFNQKIENWPPFLTHLKFTSEYTQKLENLPISLISLIVFRTYPYLDDLKKLRNYKFQIHH